MKKYEHGMLLQVRESNVDGKVVLWASTWERFGSQPVPVGPEPRYQAKTVASDNERAIQSRAVYEAWRNKLASLGAEGWEMVAIDPSEVGLAYWFKRRID